MTDRALVVQEVAYAALDALRFAIPLDLCAYLHVARGDGPQLYLRAPDLSTMSPSDAFDLFTALRDALDDSGDRDEPIAGHEVVRIRTAGDVSRGLFVVGRRTESLDEREAGLTVTIAKALGDACHTLEEDTRAATVPTVTEVNVRVADRHVHADLTFSGGQHGRAEADSTTEAVGLATLAALAPSYKLAQITDGTVADERVVLALVRDDLDNGAVGSALVSGDPVRAAAEAVADAVARLVG